MYGFKFVGVTITLFSESYLIAFSDSANSISTTNVTDFVIMMIAYYDQQNCVQKLLQKKNAKEKNHLKMN